MPFARPASSPSSSSHTSDHHGALATPAKLATPWDASSLEKQLESMKQEAAASSASSMSSSPAPSRPMSLPRSIPSPNISSMASLARDMASPDSQAMSSSSSTSSPPEQYFTSHRALKQRLFQMSDDDEDEAAKDSMVANGTSAADASSSYHSRFRTDRNAPIRQSISALSGVTVIGRGSMSSKRDSQGSISTIGSHRNSIEEVRPTLMNRTQSDNVTAPLRTKEDARSATPAASAQAGPLDMGSALHLLQMYPRAASPPRNFEEEPRPTASSRSRSMSPTAVSPRSQNAAPLPGASEGGSRPVRRHSRSSMASDLLMSPVPALSSMNSPTTASCPEHRSALPSPLDVYVQSNGQGSTQVTFPTPGGFPFSPASSLPEASSSRTLPTSSTDEESPRGKQTISSSRSVSTNDLAQIIRSFSSRSRKATGRRRSTQGQPINEARPPSASTSIPTSTSAEGLRRSVRGSRHPSNSANLGELIRQKRRMASAPFHNTASAHTSGTTSPTMASGAQSPVLSSAPEAPTWDSAAQRRARSRRGSTASTGLHLNLTANGFEEARIRALRGMGDVVMTPSVEEWKLLGLHESLNDRNGSESSGSESDTSSSDASNAGEEDSDDVPSRLRKVSKKSYDSAQTDTVYRPRMGSITSFNQYYGSAPPANAETSLETPVRRVTAREESSAAPILSRSSSRTLGQSPKKRNFRDTGSEADNSSALDDESGSDREAVPHNNRNSLPTLSRQSLSMPAGTHIPELASIRHEEDNYSNPDVQAPRAIRNIYSPTINNYLPASPGPNFSPSRASSPIPLTLGGPTDPRAYSAVTGLRNINSFAIQGEAGKGAYGLVRKVRGKDAEGRPFGPNLMLKYIVKQRILADAYKRHKVLGVIPMEIHVLDFIRRIYRGPGHPARDPISNLKKMHGIAPPTAPATADQAANQTLYGHPNLCQMLDFFEDAENYYLVMSCFGNGQDLFDYVDAAPMGLTVTESKSFLTQIVDAVAFLHSHGVVHRDIKDENIILDGKGGVQLIDFGSAAYIKEGKPYFDTFSGTLDFASPEVLRGERYGGKETDIWALGVLAYVILCGECPFWSSEESLAGLHAGCRSEAALQAKADSPEVLAEQHATGTDIDAQDAVDFVHQCLQVHARDRPPAVHLRKHRFISGKSGWTGTRGWESLDGYSSAASGFDSV